MELIQGSETSANYNLTPGKYPEENIQHSIIDYKYALQCNKSHYVPESSSLSYDRASHSCRHAICVVTQQCLVIPLISLIHCRLPA